MAKNTLAHIAPTQPGRRQFFAGTGKSGAALGALSLTSTGLAGLGMNGLAQAVTVGQTPDLLLTLGARIAIEVQSELGSANSGYSVHFLDAAGPSCDGLREGLKGAFNAHGFKLVETQGMRNHSLGEVTIRNLDTGRSATVDIFPEALTQVELIEQSFTSDALRKQAMMKTPRDSLFALS
jgi:hypothetical protein